ncbi:MAG: hypothetical protein WAW63_02940 [Candidatus Saccharimonadales bacterium]
MKTHAVRIPLIVLFLLVLVGSLVPIAQFLPGHASADYLSDARKQETLYEYGQEVKECIKVDGSGLHTEQVKLTGTPSTSNWINGNFGLSGSISTPLTLDKGSSKWCGDVLTTALAAFGYTASTYNDFFTALGYSCTAIECTLTQRQEEIPAKFNKLLADRKIPVVRDDAMTYVQLLQGMQLYCSLAALPSPSPAEQASGEANQNGYIMVYTTSTSTGALSSAKTYYKYDVAALGENDCINYAENLRNSSKSVTDAIVATFTKQSTQIEKDAVRAAVCGSAPVGDLPLARYADCITKVDAAYDKCLAQAGTAGAYYTQTKEEYTAALAACIAADTGASVDTIKTALAEAATKITDLAGGLTTTTPSASATGDNCPLPPGTSLRWLGCAVFDGLKGVANSLANTLNSLLYTPASIFDEPSAQKAATTFRNIGIALVVIAGLFMIIAEASGWQIVDAYTIRKLMPRLAIVLIGMALAWPIMRLIVTLTNDLGAIIHSVFLQLAGDAEAIGAPEGMGSSMTKMLLWITVGGGAAGYLFISLGVLGMLSLFGTVVLALLIGLFVLGIRQLVVLMCIILAPLALAAYVLPGTQKLWKFWKNTFITTLLMYPLIMGFIGAGKAMSFLLGATKAGSTDNVMQILVLIVYFAPYFMLPFAFKMAGGLMSTIFSLANDKNRGLFDRMKKGRAEIRKGRKHRADEGHLFNENNPFIKATGLNHMANMWGDPKNTLAHSARRVPGFRTAGANAASLVEAKRLAHSRKAVEEMNGNGANAEFWRAISGSYDTDQKFGGYSAAVRSRIDEERAAGRLSMGRPRTLADFQRMADILETTDGASPNEKLGGQVLRAQAGRLASMYKDPEIGKAHLLSAAVMGMASHGYIDGNDLQTVGNNLVSEGMDQGAATAVLAQAQTIGGGSRPDIKLGYGVTYDPERGYVDGMKDTERADALMKSMKGPELAAAKPQTLEKLEGHIRRKLESEDPNEVKAMRNQLFSWASRYSGAGQEFMTKALNLIDDTGLRAEFDRMEMSSVDESRRQGGPPGSIPGQGTLPGLEGLGGGGSGH